MEVRIPLRSLPQIQVHRHQTQRSLGSFIDGEFVYHYVERGHCLFRLEDKVFHLGPGHAILIPPFLPHALLAHGKEHAHLCVIHFTFPEEAVSEKGCPMVVQVGKKDQDRLLELFFQLAKAREEKVPGHELSAPGMMLELLALHLASGNQSPSPQRHPQKSWKNVEAAMKLLHGRPEHPWTLSEMSEAVDLSPNYFCRVFKAYTGEAPHAFLNYLRVERAKRLLSASGLNCSEIAARVGFSNLALFSRIFRRYAGMAPTQWAAAVR